MQHLVRLVCSPAGSSHSRRPVSWLAAALLALLSLAPALGSPAAAAAPPPVDLALVLSIANAAGPGQIVKSPDLGSDAELVQLTPELLPTLMQLNRDQKVRIGDWPIAPGVRRDVILARHEIYAPGARIIEIGEKGRRELPRSRLAFFWGVVADDPYSGVFASVDPDTGTLEGMTEAGGIRYQMTSLEPGKPGLHLLATADAFTNRAANGHKLNWSCGQEHLAQPEPLLPSIGTGDVPFDPSAASAMTAAALPGAAAPAAAATGAMMPNDGGVTNTAYDLATVAIDTDHEFLSAKFANNTTNATNYLASMFAEINVMYERDLQVQLLIGTTILRTSAATDPYTQVSDPNTCGGAACENQLQEFSTYWGSNESGVSRTVAAMLSGKSSSPFEASGIAWVSGLCSTSFGYSFSQLFTFAADSSSLPGDTLILGHEIGHNFGTRHTHCYSPPIDQCYNLESGCYSGAVSCPAPSTVQGVSGVEGTVMSYCQVGLVQNCTAAQVFHPRVVAVIQPVLQAAVGVCISPSTASVTAIRPNSGTTAGGTAVTITGSNFQTGATVTLGGAAATNVVVVSSTTITATTPAHATGTVSVVVTSSGTQSTLAQSYFYTAPPHAAKFFTVAPCRLLDTRNATGPYGGPSMAAQTNRIFVAAGQCGIPTTATAVSANITVTGAQATGYFAVFPGNAFPTGTGALSFNAGQTIASATVIALSSDGAGSFGVANGATGSAQLIVDINGYFQ